MISTVASGGWRAFLLSGEGFEGIGEWVEEVRVKGSGQECPLYTGPGENALILRWEYRNCRGPSTTQLLRFAKRLLRSGVSVRGNTRLTDRVRSQVKTRGGDFKKEDPRLVMLRDFNLISGRRNQDWAIEAFAMYAGQSRVPPHVRRFRSKSRSVKKRSGNCVAEYGAVLN